MIYSEAESKRIETLKKYDILDTPPDGTYDHIVKMVARLLNVPIAIVSLVDTDRIWFKSAFGLNINQIDREDGLCSSAILSKEFYLVEDALRDPRTLNNSLVTGEFGLRFYAAAPLTTSDGYNLGNLCVLDKKARTLTRSDQQILQDLAFVVMEQIELRLMARMAINSQNKMAYMITHDIRNAICNIPAVVEMIKESRNKNDEILRLVEIIENGAKKSMDSVDNFLNYANSLSKDIVYHMEKFNFSDLTSKVVSTNKIIAINKQQQLEFEIEEGIDYIGDFSRISEMMDNLINNAIKYTPKGKKIHVSLIKKGEKLVFSVKDEGLGMNEEDKKNAFKRFSKLSATPTGNESSTGLGLWIVKEIVRKHKGEVFVESEGKNKGTTFTVELPLLQLARIISMQAN